MTSRPNVRGTFDEFLMECPMLDLNLAQRRLLISGCWCLYKARQKFVSHSLIGFSVKPRLVYWNTVDLHLRGTWFQPLLEHRLFVQYSVPPSDCRASASMRSRPPPYTSFPVILSPQNSTLYALDTYKCRNIIHNQMPMKVFIIQMFRVFCWIKNRRQPTRGCWLAWSFIKGLTHYFTGPGIWNEDNAPLSAVQYPWLVSVCSLHILRKFVWL